MARAILGKYIRPEVLNRLRHLELRPRQLVEGTLAGAHKSPFHGFSIEFAGHREYVPGDDLRHLDWKVYYRHDRFFIKQYEMETNMVVHLVLDVSASMRYGEGIEQKLAYASQMAATLGYLVIEQTDRAALATFDDRLRETLAPSNNLSQIIRMTQTLDGVDPREKTRLGGPLGELASQAGRRGVVVILSDFFADLDDLEEALQRLRYDRHEVVLLQTLHHDEIAFDLPGMVRFAGLESDDQFLTRPEDIRESYLQAFQRFQGRLEELADANRCELVTCDTSRPISEALADYLQKRLLTTRGR